MLEEIRHCEAQLGIGAKNRAALGIAILSERRTLEDVNRHFERDLSSIGSGDDPRTPPA